MNHLSETALEHYLLGGDDDTAAIEDHLLACDDCAAHVRAQIELEMQLGEVARAATFCPGCNRILAGERCDACGATLQAGGYRIERVLVRTTHGRLYSAIDGNGNRVALKELAFVQAPTLESLAAFDRETKFLRALSHPCIPRFHASFIEGTGIHTRMYIAQDLVDGESLLARLQTHWFTDAEIVDIARRVLDILIYLQSLSPMVFHRDIKPANLLVRPDGSIALVDFGAARDVSETMGNTAVGTFGYMPLEQMAGIYDATTDLFALGASLLHLLTRREPWKLLDGNGVGLNISPGLRAYLSRLCARESHLRFPNARAARTALDEINNMPSKPAKPRSQLGMIAVSVFAVAGLGVGAGVLVAMRSEPEAPKVYVPTPHEPVVERRIVRPVPPPPPVHEEAVVEAPRRNHLEVEELLGLELVGVAAPFINCPVSDRLPSGQWPGHCAQAFVAAAHCPITERLPSGTWPAHCAQAYPDLAWRPRPVPAEIEQRLAQLPPENVSELRNQLAYAQQQLVRYPEAGIAIGKITVSPQGPGKPVRPPYYYAAAVAGRLEFALHGVQRHAFSAVPTRGQIKWMPDVVLANLGSDAVTVVGTTSTEITIEASILHTSVGAAGPLETVWPVPSFSTKVGGAYAFAGFTPGKYRFKVTTGSVSQELVVTLAKGERFDLDRALVPVEGDMGDGYLVVSSTPKAKVGVDGVETGLSTPTKLKLSAGKHRITFAYGTTRSSFPVRVVANKTITIHKDLQ